LWVPSPSQTSHQSTTIAFDIDAGGHEAPPLQIDCFSQQLE
jgi:hypothetical protein